MTPLTNTPSDWGDSAASTSLKSEKAHCGPILRQPTKRPSRQLKAGIYWKIRPSDYVVSLEINGKSFSSEKLAEHMEKLTISGKSSVLFVIGGSLGLSREVSDRADLKLSFSAMTFPHQMMRVILLEQIYRAFKIMKNEAYHK